MLHGQRDHVLAVRVQVQQREGGPAGEARTARLDGDAEVPPPRGRRAPPRPELGTLGDLADTTDDRVLGEVTIVVEGFVRARIDGVTTDLEGRIKLAKNKKHDIELVVDRLAIPAAGDSDDDFQTRLADSVETVAELFAEAGYGEDRFGNNIPLPPELAYLRRLHAPATAPGT